MLLDDALRAAIRAELDTLFEEKLKPLLEARPIPSTQIRPDAPLYVSSAEAARMIGVSLCTVQAWVRQNRLRAYKAGRLLRIRVDDLEAFISRAPRGEVIDLDEAARRIMLRGGRRPPSR
jgi:excisionase family DNA binding protein